MIVAPATVTVIVAVGIAIITVVLERMNVCDDAPDDGTGFGSANVMNNPVCFAQYTHSMVRW